MPTFIILIFRSLIDEVWHGFSIKYLINTLIQPWKRDITIPINPSLQDYFKSFIDNLVSRVVGFVVRFFTILAGFLSIVILSLGFVITIITWYLLPIIFVLSFVKAITIIS
jgi:hypothetical protein